jgi:hypothetical protein
MRATKPTGYGFTPIDPKDIPTPRGGRVSRYTVTLGEFVRSGAKAVEVDLEDAKNPASAACQMRKNVRLMKLEKSVCVVCRQGRIFLLRTAA